VSALAALVLLALAGCGEPDPVDIRGDTLRLTLNEYEILPRQIRVTGPEVHIVARDPGILTHNIKIFSTTKVDAEDKPVQIGKGTKTAHPGETVDATVRLGPGKYRLACSIANHDDLGMHAVLTVRGRS
jgi:uncharacterized cupredoxin-like copper-binding protein